MYIYIYTFIYVYVYAPPHIVDGGAPALFTDLDKPSTKPMARLWHHGTITPRAPPKIQIEWGEMTKSKS